MTLPGAPEIFRNVYCKIPMRPFALVSIVLAFLLSMACASEGGSPGPAGTPDLEATVQAAAPPTATPTPTPDINATITASMIATEEAESTPQPTPTPTPNIDATVTARTAATIAAIPTAVPTREPTGTPAPTPTSTATPEPTTIPTTLPAPTRRPAPTPRPTFTPRPAPTPVPTSPAGPSLSEMVKQVRPAVVRIQTGSGGGSGVIFETQGQTGYVITNHHVVEGYSQVNVVVNDSTTYRGTVRGSDRVRDLAVVSICCGSFRTLSFGDASRLEPGDEVIAIGYALGLTGEASITRGIVSAMRYDNRRQSNVIQTDAAMNPGNSGGPMLSTDGEILGINTFRIDEADSGRAAEGLGFAVSETTVQQRIPALKTARAAPASTPTRRPSPTRSFGGGFGYGPASGELWHEPSDGLIKTEFADVLVSDMLVWTTFVNPYSGASNGWDYGFIIRETGTGASSSSLHIVVTSRGYWVLSIRRGARDNDKVIGEGRLKAFDTSAGGRNTLLVATFGDQGMLFVNGDFLSLLDLSSLADAGDVAVMTGVYTGSERAGAVTRFEDFQVFPLRRAYGPASGTLRAEARFIASHDSSAWTRDLVAEATFVTPSGRNWDYGFSIRNPDSDRLDVVGIDGSGSWFHKTREVGDNEYTDVADGSLRGLGVTLESRNHLVLLALEEVGMFLVNGQLVARLDLSHNLEYGDVGAMANFYFGHRGSPKFENFTVWTP